MCEKEVEILYKYNKLYNKKYILFKNILCIWKERK